MPDHLVYLASPYTATREYGDDVRPDPETEAYRATCAASCAARMMEAGTLVYSPIAHGHALVTAAVRPLDVSYARWMRHCLRMLRTCDELAVLAIPGWRESRGVQTEIAEARRIGIPVRFVDGMGGEVEVRDV